MRTNLPCVGRKELAEIRTQSQIPRVQREQLAGVLTLRRREMLALCEWISLCSRLE